MTLHSAQALSRHEQDLCAELNGSCINGVLTLKDPGSGYYRVRAARWHQFRVQTTYLYLAAKYLVGMPTAPGLI